MTIIFAWPIISFLGLLIYRRVLIGYDGPIYLALISDLLLVAIMFFLSIRRESRFAKISSSLLALYILFYYWFDTCVMVAVNYHLTWDIFIANYKYVNTIGYFISTKLVIFTLFALALPLILCKKVFRPSCQVSSINLLSYQSIFILVVAYLAINYVFYADKNVDVLRFDNTTSLTKSVTTQTLTTIEKKYAKIAQKTTDFFQGTLWKTLPPQQTNRPNIVIILSEALSGVDSKYAGGLFNRLPNIDKIQQDGIVFKNAVSNGKITVHGLASLLLGVQPIKTGGYKTIEEQFPAEKFSANNLIDYARKAGYQTIVISPGQAPKWFGLSDWFKKVGFQTLYDRDSVEFKDSPRFTWGAPSDEAMYTLAKKLVAQEKKPFLLLIETVSLHPPYILPDKKYRITNSDLLNQIHYVDETTYSFYQYLKEKTSFFNNGILVLAGDHRRFESLEPEELEDGGYAHWHERIVATVVGKNVTPKTIINEPYSLIDINILLHYILSGQTVVDSKLISKANLSALLGYNKPFSVTLADEKIGSYLVRNATHPPMYFSAFGDINFNEIPYDPYKAAAIYLIQNHQYTSKILAN